MKCTYIEARDLPDSWFRLVYELIQTGRKEKIDFGSYQGQKRLEFDHITVNIKFPCFGNELCERLPDIPAHYGIPNPVNPDYVFGGSSHVDEQGNPLRTYVEYLMTPVMHENESYTYGQRLTEYPIHDNILTERALFMEGELKDKKPKEIINHVDDNELWDNPKIIISNPINNYLRIRSYYFNQIEYAIWRYKKSGWRNN